MDMIDMMYANEMSKREDSHSTYIFQMQNWVKNDPYVTENAWKYEVYARLRDMKKKIPDITVDEIENKVNTITDTNRQGWWTYAWALILSEFYGLPLRMVADRDHYDGIPDDKFGMMKRYGRVSDAYHKYQIQEQWELTADGKVKTLDPAMNNEINKVDIDSTELELNEWKKILQRLEEKLKTEINEEVKKEIENDIEKAQNQIKNLSHKK